MNGIGEEVSVDGPPHGWRRLTTLIKTFTIPRAKFDYICASNDETEYKISFFLVKSIFSYFAFIAFT